MRTGKAAGRVALAACLLAMLACQVGGTRATPAPVTATVPPLPTVGVPTRVLPTSTALTVATPTPTATVEPVLGAISGAVWHDLCAPWPAGAGSPASPPPGCVADAFGAVRADGVHAGDEPGLAGVVVRLGAGACPSTGLAESATAASGPSYTFEGLQPGAYCISIDPFAAANLNQLLPGQWTYPGVAEGLLGQTVSLAQGQRLTDISFGWDYQLLPAGVSATPSGCTYAAALAHDVTLPANSVVTPGATFVKSWAVTNMGSCYWGRPEDLLRSVVLVGGTALGAPEVVALPREVPPGFQTTVSITFTAPAVPGTYLSEWMLLAEPDTLIGVGPGGTAPLAAQFVVTTTTTTIRPGAVFTAPRASPVPNIDGALDDWPGLPYAMTAAAYRPENWAGPADHSAAFAVGWDTANLYLAVRVADDIYVQTQTGDTLFRGDSLELLLDTNLVGDFDDDGLNADDFQLGLSAGANRITPEAYLWFPTSRRGRASLLLIPRPDGTGQGYVLEAAIPWATFGITPAAGSTLGFVLSSSDNDTPGTAEQQSMISTEAGRRLADPTTWGTLILGP